MSYIPTSPLDVQHGHMLPADFVPGSFDVLCSRGMEAHKQNSKFRATIQMHMSLYVAATSTHAKSTVINKVVNAIRQRSLNGGFVRIDPSSGLYFEVGDFHARQIVSRAFQTATQNEGPKRHHRRIRHIMKPVEKPCCELQSEIEEDNGEAEVPPPPLPSFTTTMATTFFHPSDFRMTYSTRDLLCEDDDEDRRCFSTRDLLDECDNNENARFEEEPSFNILRLESTMAAYS
jgi:hypothetical protein